jgi:hypothetical protein
MFRLCPYSLILVVILLTGCESIREQDCNSDEQKRVNEYLYFGTAKPDGVVSIEEWSGFLKTVVTPLFPEGLTVLNAYGQWRSSDGLTSSEDAYVLNLVHTENIEADSAIELIMEKYKSQFQQESVMRVRSLACVSFN